MAEIIGSSLYPDLVGRLAIIDMQYAKIFKAEPSASAVSVPSPQS